MNKPFDRAFLAWLLPTVGLGLALMTAGAAGAQAQVIGASGTNGADGVHPGDLRLTGGEGQSVTGSGTVTGGNGGKGGDAGPPSYYTDGNGGDGGAGGSATATGVNAIAYGGNGGPGGAPALPYPPETYGFGGGGGPGGAATAIATGSSGTGNIAVSAYAWAAPARQV